MRHLDPSINKETSQRIEELTHTLFETAPCGYLFTEPGGRLLKINTTLLDWLGYEAEDLVGKVRLYDLVSLGGRIYYETNFAPLLQLQHSVAEVNFNLLAKDGSSVPVLLSAYQHHDEDGNALFNSIVAHNFTERKKYEQDLLQAKKAAESSDRAKSYFLSTFSHEVLTPLNAIIGTADLLETTPLDDHQRQLHTLLTQSSQHLLELFKNVLVVAKSGLESLEVNAAPLDVRTLAQNVIASFRYEANDRGIRLKLEVDSRVPAALLGDSVLISQVLTNLVSNAVKFTEAGEVQVNIRVVEEEGSRYRIEFRVTDTGIGISAEQISQLFQPFTQAKDSIHSQYGGSGLGLTICRSILDRYGSKIKVESEPGRGSDFAFDLLLPAAALKPKSKLPLAKLPSLNGGKVLLVEDNPTNAFLVARHFKHWDVRFDTATNGRDAVRQVAQNDYAIVLMDLKMPIMDGYEASLEIRKLPAPKNSVPIIAFSASASTSMSSRMREAKINSFLLKPFDPRDLHSIIDKHLSLSTGSPIESASPSMNFPTLREAFDEDRGELADFVAVLSKELRAAADQIDLAFANKNAQSISDLKHKLKTSLQLLEEGDVKAALQSAADGIRAGRDTSRERAFVQQSLHKLVKRLEAERW